MATNQAASQGLNLTLEEIRTLENLRSKIMPLTLSIEGLQQEIQMRPDTLPNWDTIHRSSALISGYLGTLQTYLHSKPESDPDKPSPAQILATLRPYPISPFPAVQFGPLVDTLLRKSLDPKDNKWVDERLSTAATFCHVPTDWNVEPKPLSDDPLPSTEGEDGEGAESKLSARRVKSVMEEDDIEKLWAEAGQGMDTQKSLFGMALQPPDSSEEPLPEELREYVEKIRKDVKEKGGILPDEEEEGDDEDEEMEGVMGGKVEEGMGKKQAIMPLNTMLKFMSTGSVDL